jgi:hypothetical protein
MRWWRGGSNRTLDHTFRFPSDTASGQLVWVAPIGDRVLEKGDIVLCKVNGHNYLHLITRLLKEKVIISNLIGACDFLTVYGLLHLIEGRWKN